MTGGAPGDRDLDRTPTWAVASICIVIILISIALEQALHRLGHVSNPTYHPGPRLYVYKSSSFYFWEIDSDQISGLRRKG